MYMLLSSLTRSFNFTFERAQSDDFELERDDFTVGSRAVCQLVARAVPMQDNIC
ncbi:hypothetical protein F5Y19DRAFT_443708 [Xylariaceae sp. FL1651]|nr:hypothetical protein F5Y19DRAFT_443708 [Xylariaceae sp. FL1651]